jgi:iron-only hydrogenase group A
MLYFTLNNKKVSFKKGETILEVAKREKIDIPTLCHHPDFKVRAVCRICVVEVKGENKLLTACSTKVKEGMQVKTNSLAVKKARNVNLELIFATHREECSDCVLLHNCPLLKYAKKYKLSIGRFSDRKNNRSIYNFANSVEIDSRQCIDCGTCVEVCKQGQKLACLEFVNKGVKQELRPVKDKICIYCGQCALHCPVFAAQEQVAWPILNDKIKNNNKKILVAQIAPSVRASLSEAFSLESGQISIGQIASALKILGFNYVFDVNFAADVTTMVEAEELLERLADKKAVLPMMTSCCPAWVRYVEAYRPDLIANLTSSRSPQMHNAGLIKTYFAKKEKINPKDIYVVSIMPCTAKKYESRRKELKIKGQFLVDLVLTVRELSFLLQAKKINPAQLKDSNLDIPLSEHSGAAAIYGASGGVMESALRTAANCSDCLDFKTVRGQKGIKEAEFNIKGKTVRVAVVSGIGFIEPVLKNLKKYDYIEVMACPGGCIGGGGQIIPTTKEIVKKRAASLYKIDKNLKLRRADENLAVKEILNWLREEKLSKQVLHTCYKKNKK